jgi:uncharacterized protein (TIGR03435 family)
VKQQILVAALAIGGAVIGQALVTAQFGTAPPADPDAQFEAASIKPADPSSPGARMGITPGRMEMIGVPARLLLRQAFRVQDYQIVGAPDWLSSERYAIVAKMPENSPPSNTSAMITNLLKDRFKLVTHTESREMPVYALVIARADGKLGPNLKETSAECKAMVSARAAGPGRPGGPGGPDGRPGGPGAGVTAGPGGAGAGRGAGGPPTPVDLRQPVPCGMMGTGPGLSAGGGQPIQALVQTLSNAVGRPVVDKTGLTGAYDFNLRGAFDPGQGAGPLGAPPPGAILPTPDPDAPNLFTALQEQLGLKLESQRAPVDVVVVDRIEKPSLD